MRTLILMLCFCLCFQASAQEKEGGIIGTGVLGQITALGSIYVNGQYIQFTPEMEIEGVANVSELEPGMTVAAGVIADGSNWRANTLRRIPVLVGPVTGENEVMNVKVQGETLPASGWVIVDGFWSTHGVQASRVASTSADTAIVSGPFGPGGFVGMVPFSGISPEHLDIGQHITVTGSFEQSRLNSESLRHGVFIGTQPELVLAEGYLSQPDPAGLYRLIGSNAIAYTETPSMVDVTQRVILCSINGKLDFKPSELKPSQRAQAEEMCAVQ